jgi:Sec-independent protein translocase protein TatA
VFDISPEKILVVLVAASLVLGPSRLRDAGRGLARARRELRRLTGALDPGTQRLLRHPGAALVQTLVEPFDVDEPPEGSE